MIVRHLKPRRRKVQFKSQLKFKTCWFSESTLNMMRSLVTKNNLVLYFLINMNLCVVIFRALNKIVAFLFHFPLIHFKKCSPNFMCFQAHIWKKRAYLCKLHDSKLIYFFYFSHFSFRILWWIPPHLPLILSHGFLLNIINSNSCFGHVFAILAKSTHGSNFSKHHCYHSRTLWLYSRVNQVAGLRRKSSRCIWNRGENSRFQQG